jgi:hypothetical protein
MMKLRTCTTTRKISQLVAALTSVVFSTQQLVFAEPEPPTAQPPQQRDRYLELLLWEHDLAQGGYSINPTVENFSRFLTALEKLVYRSCLPNIARTLTPPTTPPSQECLSRIAETLALDSRNAAAICARDGLFSDTCNSRYNAIQQRVLGSVTPSAQNELDIQLAKSKDGGKIAQLRSQFVNLERGLDRVKKYKPEERLKLENERLTKIRVVADELMELACKVEEFSVEEEKVIAPTISPSPLGITRPAELPVQPSSIRDELKKQSLALGVTKDTDIARDPSSTKQPILSDKIVRIRLITPECSNIAKRMSEVIKNYPPAVCRKLGLYAPSCIKGLGEFRRRQVLEQRSLEDSQGGGEPSSDFETF